MNKLASTASSCSSYSHGLEAVYTFENINPKTICHFVQPSTQKAAPQEKAKSASFGFFFDPESDFSLPSFRLYEPLEVLGLSHLSLKFLENTKDMKVVDLHTFLLSEKARLLPIPCIQEMTGKLEVHVGKEPHAPKRTLDFHALLRILLQDLSPLERFSVLSPYGLISLYSFSQTVKQEYHLLSHSEKGVFFKTCLQKAQSKRLKDIQQFIDQIHSRYILPWLKLHYGVTLANSLNDFLLSCLEGSSEVVKRKLLECVSDFSQKNILFSNDPHLLYAQDEKIQADFLNLISKAEAYFYSPCASYPLDTLLEYVFKECATEWLDLSKDQLKHYLHSSDHFVIFRKECGTIWIEKF